jgi:hypothetical protein
VLAVGVRTHARLEVVVVPAASRLREQRALALAPAGVEVAMRELAAWRSPLHDPLAVVRHLPLLTLLLGALPHQSAHLLPDDAVVLGVEVQKC